MSTVETIEIAFPVNTNLDDFVHHYAALFNAHGVKHDLPATKPSGERFGNSVPEAHTALLQDFKKVNLQLYDYKNLHMGNVEVTDIKVVGKRAYLSVKLGR